MPIERNIDNDGPQADKISPPSASVGNRSRWTDVKERVIEALLFMSAFSSVVITAGIVGVLVYESSTFFSHVSLVDFFTDTLWTPLFGEPRFGIMPLIAGT